MKKYRVGISYPCFVTVEVEAEDEESATNIALKEGCISGYGGNDKLIGVNGSNCSIQASDEPLEEYGFPINCEEIEG